MCNLRTSPCLEVCFLGNPSPFSRLQASPPLLIPRSQGGKKGFGAALANHCRLIKQPCVVNNSVTCQSLEKKHATISSSDSLQPEGLGSAAFPDTRGDPALNPGLLSRQRPSFPLQACPRSQDRLREQERDMERRWGAVPERRPGTADWLGQSCARGGPGGPRGRSAGSPHDPPRLMLFDVSYYY